MLQSFRSNAFLKRAVAPVAAGVAALIGIGAFTAPAHAEFDQGDYELRVSGFAQNDVNFEGVFANAAGTLGYFFTDQFEGGIRQDLAYNDLAGSDMSGATSLFVNYHFGEDGQPLQPFIGANIGYIYGDSVNDTFVGGPEAGIKYFFNEAWFLFGQVEYAFFFEEGDEADEAFDDGTFKYRLGLGVVLP